MTYAGKFLRGRTRIAAAAFAFAIVSATVATAADKIVYPEPPAGTPVSTLIIENTLNPSQWSMKGGIGLVITLDGFSLMTGAKLKGAGTLWGGKKYIPVGESAITIAAGSHAMVHTAENTGNGWHSPVFEMAFDTEEGKTYRVKFLSTGTALKKTYTIEYEGWSREQIAQWPSESAIARGLGR